MKIEIKTGPNYNRMVKKLGSMAIAIRGAVDAGLETGAIDAASHVATSKLTGQDLKVRSGQLRREIKGGLEQSGTAFVGIESPSSVDNYSWQIMGGPAKTITAKRAKFLAIPLSAALTPAGRPRFPEGPRSVEDLFFIKSKSGQGLLVRQKPNRKRENLEALFILKRSVTITPTDALPEGVTEKIPDITEAIQKQLDKMVNSSQ
jgi:hypothetical protein